MLLKILSITMLFLNAEAWSEVSNDGNGSDGNALVKTTGAGNFGLSVDMECSCDITLPSCSSCSSDTGLFVVEVTRLPGVEKVHYGVGAVSADYNYNPSLTQGEAVTAAPITITRRLSDFSGNVSNDGNGSDGNAQNKTTGSGHFKLSVDLQCACDINLPSCNSCSSEAGNFVVTVTRTSAEEKVLFGSGAVSSDHTRSPSLTLGEKVTPYRLSEEERPSTYAAKRRGPVDCLTCYCVSKDGNCQTAPVFTLSDASQRANELNRRGNITYGSLKTNQEWKSNKSAVALCRSRRQACLSRCLYKNKELCTHCTC